VSQIPFIPENAPFTPEQRLWLNGYLAGLFSDAAGDLAQRASTGLTAAPAKPAKPLVVLYGSQTGTAEGLAKKTAKAAESKGFAPKVVCMEKYESAELTKAEHVLVITSTYGDGEPPDNAHSFWNWISSEGAPRLANTRFSVLALGDTNYPQFCEFGKKCDERFEQLGAKRVHPRADCDIDYDHAAKVWTDGVLVALAGSETDGSDAIVVEAAVQTTSTRVSKKTGFSRENPFPARLLVNRKLTTDKSDKEVRHFEISLSNSGISYEVGDALGVLPQNCPQLVSDLLATLGFDGEEPVPGPDGTEMPLRLALLQYYDINKASSELLKASAARQVTGELTYVLAPEHREELKTYLWGREIIDIVTGLDEAFAPSEFVALLKKLQPRLYSISSSPKAHPDEVHLTVGAVRYSAYGRVRKGVCSTFLADRSNGDTALPVWIQPSHGFKLPADASRDIIMVGPGTGIAPFRAFLEEREIAGAAGRNWLFFGDQRRASDFLYEEQLTVWQARGHLTRLDLAFSRDQAEKVYVQHRMLEQATDVWEWMENGAHFYVCGDATRMAKDVDASLHRICEVAGGLSHEAAAEYVNNLRSVKRYQRDVY
jgi:sulfite reductase (NADPH) flavoprotein alpha-component